MNISYNWLKDYLDFDLTPEETGKALTSIGLETGCIEEIQTIKGGLEGLVIGKVLTCIDHPNSDHLHVTTVDLGNGEPVQIVCGAPNVATGQKVIVATIGTKLYDGDETFTIKKSKIRGIESNGMICAEDEIGIGTDHSGIIVLPENAKTGTPAKEYYNIKSDYLLEVDITPNRSDAVSHFGVARDLAAYLKQNNLQGKLKQIPVDTFTTEKQNKGVTIEVLNTEACPRYSGITICGVTVKESPAWLQERLKTIGLRPINNVVDVTNYILHETGQPLHAFDRAKITGDKILVKTMPEGTKFITLDGEERILSNQDLMICNTQEAMCIGGVFGGLDSGVTEKTTDIFLESAYFHPTWIRKTARRHGLNTDASFRFERGCDPNNTIYVLKRAALLIQEVAGGTITGEIQDNYPNPIKPAEVKLTYEKINNLIGKKIPEETVKSILQSLEIQIIEENQETLTLHIPTYRVDVTRDVDVIEDILRIYGYNNIEISEELKSNLSYKSETDKSNELRTLISEQLTGSGFNEIMCNSLTASTHYAGLYTYPEAKLVYLKNPLSSDLNVMRQTLLFGGLQSIAYNRNRKNSNLAFYEFGNCYQFDKDKHNQETALSGYTEEFRLALWLCGNKISNNWAHPDEPHTIFELKAHIQNILKRLGINTARLIMGKTENDLYNDALSIHTMSGRNLGTLGIIRKKILKPFDIDTEIYYAELNWNTIMREIRKHKVQFTEISKYPSVKRDLALLIDTTTTFDDIAKLAYDTEKHLLRDVQLFDVYEGKNLPAGKKSYGVSFWLQDDEKTLKDKQIDAIMKKIQTNLEERLNAKLR